MRVVLIGSLHPLGGEDLLIGGCLSSWVSTEIELVNVHYEEHSYNRNLGFPCRCETCCFYKVCIYLGIILLSRSKV